MLVFGLWCGVAEISPPPLGCMERDKSRMIRQTKDEKKIGAEAMETNEDTHPPR